MGIIDRLAPSGDVAVDYDRRHLALYAALLDANDSGVSWQDAASSLMRLDLADLDAEACWRSHLDRAHWFVGAGLAAAITAFSVRQPPGHRSIS